MDSKENGLFPVMAGLMLTLIWIIEEGFVLHMKNMIWYGVTYRVLCKDTYFNIFCDLSCCKLFNIPELEYCL